MSANEAKTGKGFPSTHWTKVYQASDHDKEEGSRALAGLLKTYRPALRQYLRHRFDVSSEEIEDWISEFIAQKILERGLLRVANPAKGRFRSFLLTALYRFAEDRRRGENRSRRRPTGGLVSLEEKHENLAVGNSHPSPGDVRWATTVIDRARRRTEEFYRNKGSDKAWEVFAAGCYRPLRHGEERPSDAELARVHGYKSARQVSNVITNAKRRFGIFVREIIREYECNEGGVDEELHDLVAILAADE